MTLPLDRYESVPGAGSVNIIADQKATQLWRSVKNDTVGGYLKAHPEDELPDAQDVS